MDQATNNPPSSAAQMVRAIEVCLVAIIMLLGTYSWLRAG